MDYLINILDIIGNHGANDYLIINADVNGTILWQKCFGGSLDDNPHSVTQTNDGGFIIAGTTFSNDGNIQGFYDYADYWVVKTDANGMLLWQKCYGGLSNDRAYCIRQTIDGGYILAGFTYSANGDVTLPSSNNINDPSFSEGWIVKINSNGFIEWNRIVDYPTPNNAFSISQTSDGGYIAVGLTLSGGFFLVKLQNTTSLIDLDDSGSKIYPNPANNYINIKANSGTKTHSFSITNCLGKQILSGSNINESTAVDLTEISSGIYFINLFDENNTRIKTEKFIKQ